MKVFVIDAGAFGTAMAALVAPNHEVTLMIQDFNQAQKDLYFNLQYGAQKCNYLYLKNIELPPMEFTDNFDSAKTADVVFLAVPSQYLCKTYLKIREQLLLNRKCILVLLTKGMDSYESIPWGLKLQKNLKLSLGYHNFAVLSGYTPAHGIAVSQSTWKYYAASVASENLNVIKKMRKLFLGTNLGIIGTTDVAGVSLGGALKNAYAIGYGIVIGSGNGELGMRYLQTAHREMKIFLDHFRAMPKTFESPAIKNDFYLTSTGEINWESRNVSFGKFLAKFQSKADIQEYVSKNTVEGYEAMKVLYAIAQKEKIDAPLLHSIHAICELGQSPDILAFLCGIVETIFKHKPVN